MALGGFIICCLGETSGMGAVDERGVCGGDVGGTTTDC